MKNCRKVLTALMFALLLSTSALAGEMQTGITSQPPPPEQRTGEMHTDKAAITLETDTVTRLALGLLQNLLPMF